MTSVPPLSDVHKIGIFGNTENKDESNLLEVSEETSKSIYQITKFKNSNSSVSNLSIQDLEISNNPMIVKSNSKTRILWTGPYQWLIISDDKILEDELKVFDSNNFAVTDLSNTRAIINVKGQDSLEVLKKGCPYNFNNLEKNMSINSVYHSIAVTVDFIEDNPHKMRIMCLRSFGESLYHSITDACLEYGYKAI